MDYDQFQKHQISKAMLHAGIEAEVKVIQEKMRANDEMENWYYMKITKAPEFSHLKYPQDRSRDQMLEYIAALRFEADMMQDEIADKQHSKEIKP